MGKEQDKDYYNLIYMKAYHYSLNVSADDTIYRDLYNKVRDLLTFDENILELGCGTGQFAKKLIDEEFKYIAGIDFSEEATSLSRERCKVDKFICQDLILTDTKLFDFDTIICLETLEHIEKDIEILSGIEKGKRVILSLPSFDDPSHVRYFPDRSDILTYYSGVLDHIKIYKIDRHYVVDSISS